MHKGFFYSFNSVILTKYKWDLKGFKNLVPDLIQAIGGTQPNQTSRLVKWHGYIAC